MIEHQLKIALRNILKNRAYSLINVFGLAFGMMSSIYIVLWIVDELSYDRFHTEADRIFRINWYSENPQTRTPHPMSHALATDMPEIEFAVSLTPIWGEGLTRPMRTVKYRDKQFEEDAIFAADTSFFDLFNFNLIKGNPETALKDVGGLIISKKMASKYFGDEDPLGKHLLINFGADRTFFIAGVMEDIPANAHFKFDFLISYITLKTQMPEYFFGWEDFGHYNYIRLREGAGADLVEQKVNEWTKKYIDYSEENLASLAAGRIRFNLQPITSIHLYSDVRWELEPGGDIAHVRIFSSLALFILLIACINFMNLATAKVANRSVEIGLKKVVGASRQQLIQQFYGEALLSAFFAITVALILFELLADGIGTLTDKTYVLDYTHPLTISLLLGMVLLCTLIAGTYPALILSRSSPVNIIKGTPGRATGGVDFRKILVVFQFGISTFLILAALVVGAQLRFMRHQKMGFTSQDVVVIPMKDTVVRHNYESVKQEFLASSNILSVTAVSNIPGRSFNQNPVRWKKDELTYVDVSEYSVDHDFFAALGLEIAAGRSFERSRKSDYGSSLVINRETASRFEWTDPVNEDLIWYDDDTTRLCRVIGVVENFHFQSLRKSIEPLIISMQPEAFNYFLVRINSNQIPSGIAHLDLVYNSADQQNEFTYFFLDDELDQLYNAEEKVESVFSYFTALAIIISCVGLFGLSSYNAERRTKEIGIRKVNGASNWVIVGLLSGDFLKWVLLAFVLACPVSWMIMTDWLSDFAYHPGLSWYYFVGTGFIVLATGMLTVGFHALRTTRKNPVDVLKYE